jgi:hypothetical protein
MQESSLLALTGECIPNVGASLLAIAVVLATKG